MPPIDENLREFLIEGHEYLGQVEQLMLAMESGPTPAARSEAVQSCFRLLHSIKGGAGFLGLKHLESLGHGAENLLAKIRSGEIVPEPVHFGWLLACVDGLKKLLATIEATGTDESAAGDVSAILASFGKKPSPAVPQAAPAKPVEAKPVPPSPPAQAGSGLAALQPAVVPPSVADAPSEPEGGAAGASMLAEATVRIGVETIDRLMALASELVLARNRVVQASESIEDAGYQAATRQLNLVTSELQEVVMRTRMQPISGVWSKLPRMVRDLARHLGKHCRIDLEGGDTELDKTLLEAVKAPLTHLARNAVDHGIEPPANRLAMDKPAEGRILLRASHEAGQVTVEMSDDGRGIDASKVRSKVASQRLAGADDLARMSDSQVMQFVFISGFSTADRVTEVSGRGVGMDVVKTSIESMGGSIDLSSVMGKGTTVRLRLPLTLAIIKAVIVRVGTAHVAIPQAGIIELMRLDTEKNIRAVTRVGGGIYLRFRSELMPLIETAEVLGCSPEESFEEAFSVVVVHAEKRQFALKVDRILDSQEIVVKPLPTLLKGIPSYSGTTLLGDGSIALIVDPVGVARLAGLHGRRGEALAVAEAAKPVESRSLLLVESTDGRLQAIPLDAVDRLEEIPREKIEKAGDNTVVQYRGGILPLFDASSAPTRPLDISVGVPDRIAVVVHRAPSGLVGMVVGRIIDTVSETGPGEGGMAIVRGSVAQVVDPQRWLAGVA
ncbi:MAG: chemotaxis protein CheA [Planctomycetes bacterium]|nr:chemotaxis protein CheA [Planctomycetota bacterium]